MDEKQLQPLTNELVKNLKTSEGLSQFDRLLKKLCVEAALNAEITHHLGYKKSQPKQEATPAIAIPQRVLLRAKAYWNVYSTRSRRPLRTWATFNRPEKRLEIRGIIAAPGTEDFSDYESTIYI